MMADRDFCIIIRGQDHDTGDRIERRLSWLEVEDINMGPWELISLVKLGLEKELNDAQKKRT